MSVPWRKPASRWTGDFWLKGVSLILAYLSTFLVFCRFDDFLCFEICFGFWVFANQLTVHNGGVSRGRVRSVAVAVPVSDR